MMTEIDIYNHPDWHHCPRLQCWIQKRTCAYYAKYRQECLGCKIGKAFEKKLKIKPLVVKPKVQLKSTPKLRTSSKNWDQIMARYNDKHGTRWSSMKKWLESGWKIHGYNIADFSREIGVAPATLRDKLIKYKIKKPNADAPIIKELFLAIPESKMATMTKWDIMRQIGISEGYLGELLLRYNRDYIQSYGKQKSTPSSRDPLIQKKSLA